MNRKHRRRMQKGQPESEEETVVSAVSWNPREANASRRLSQMLLRGGVRPPSPPQPKTCHSYHLSEYNVNKSGGSVPVKWGW